VISNKRILLAGISFGVAAAFGVPGAAYAQSQASALGQASDTDSNFRRDRNVSVSQRPHEGYEALGIRAGAFILWPKLTTTGEYNDNIYAQSTGKESDAVWHVTPEVDLTSNWSRHSLQAYARTTFNRYSDHTTENTDDYSVGANGQLDVLRNAQINGGVDWSRFTEPRTSSGSPADSLHPVQYTVGSVYASGAEEFNRLRLSGRLDLREFNYFNGVDTTGAQVFEDDRDRTLTIATARADYAVSPDTALFVEVAGNKRDYRLASPPAAQDRDSSGVEALVGANFDISALMRGEVGVGYLKQNYDASNFKDISGLGVRGQVEWFPTQLVTATFTGSRTLEDAGIVGSSGYLSTNIGARVDYELLRNVLLGAQVGYGDDNYRGVDREDKRTTFGLNATYLLNRNIGVTVGYNYFKQNSSGTDGGNDFKVNKIGATLTLQY
jgi:hypothetical protein